MIALYILLIGVVAMLFVGFLLALALAGAAQLGDEMMEGWDHDHEWWKDQP